MRWLLLDTAVYLDQVLVDNKCSFYSWNKCFSYFPKEHQKPTLRSPRNRMKVWKAAAATPPATTPLQICTPRTPITQLAATASRHIKLRLNLPGMLFWLAQQVTPNKCSMYHRQKMNKLKNFWNKFNCAPAKWTLEKERRWEGECLPLPLSLFKKQWSYLFCQW